MLSSGAEEKAPEDTMSHSEECNLQVNQTLSRFHVERWSPDERQNAHTSGRVEIWSDSSEIKVWLPAAGRSWKQEMQDGTLETQSRSGSLSSPWKIQRNILKAMNVY